MQKGMFFYTVVNLSYFREKYNLRTCFKKKELMFLHKQDTISRGLANRLTIRSNYIQSYKQLKYFYILLLKNNIGYNKGSSIIKSNKINNSKFYSKDISYFLEAYNQSLYAFNDLDRVLIWRASQINSIFKVIQTEKRKKKKYIYTSRLQFVQPYKRILTVWRWLSVFIKVFTVKNKKWNITLLPSFENFLTTKYPNNVIINVKLQVYKLKLLRTV